MKTPLSPQALDRYQQGQLLGAALRYVAEISTVEEEGVGAVTAALLAHPAFAMVAALLSRGGQPNGDDPWACLYTLACLISGQQDISG